MTVGFLGPQRIIAGLLPKNNACERGWRMESLRPGYAAGFLTDLASQYRRDVISYETMQNGQALVAHKA